MLTNFNLERYNQLQYLRETDTLTADEEQELSAMCMEYMFDLIETTPELKAVFTRLKDR